jgi:hypothetical protein
MGRYPNGKGSYAQKRANDELMIYIRTLEDKITAQEKRLTALEDGQGVLLKEANGSVSNEITKVKKLMDNSLADLKKLAAELGVNDTDLKTKADYVGKIKEKDPTLE